MITLKKKILLASNSPRRKQLLEQLGFMFEVVNIRTDESYSGIDAAEVSGFLAEKKARAFAPLETDTVLLCADTVVVINGKVLGKPADRDEAIKMLKILSGAAHEVYTSVCLREGDGYFRETDVARVTFRTLTDEEITYYVDTYRPFDKAGAYGVQEWIGMAGIEHIEGSFYTIMGLPTHLVYRMLQPYIMAY